MRLAPERQLIADHGRRMTGDRLVVGTSGNLSIRVGDLLAVTPAVQMTRIDVGGNRAGTQTGYTAYGMSGQVRVLIEGINTTEGTGGAGFYFDYASLEEAFMELTRDAAEYTTSRGAAA